MHFGADNPAFSASQSQNRPHLETGLRVWPRARADLFFWSWVLGGRTPRKYIPKVSAALPDALIKVPGALSPMSQSGHLPGHIRATFVAAVAAFVDWKGGDPEPNVELSCEP